MLEKNTVITAAHCCREEYNEVDAFFGDSKSTFLTGKVDGKSIIVDSWYPCQIIKPLNSK